MSNWSHEASCPDIDVHAIEVLPSITSAALKHLAEEEASALDRLTITEQGTEIHHLGTGEMVGDWLVGPTFASSPSANSPPKGARSGLVGAGVGPWSVLRYIQEEICAAKIRVGRHGKRLCIAVGSPCVSATLRSGKTALYQLSGAKLQHLQ